MAKVKINGLAKLERRLHELPEEIRQACREAVDGETEQAADDLRRGAPVLSGKLQRSIQKEIAEKGLAGTAAITAAHAAFVINGTSKQEANDFVTPVIAKIRRRFPDRLAAEVRAVLRKG